MSSMYDELECGLYSMYKAVKRIVDLPDEVSSKAMQDVIFRADALIDRCTKFYDMDNISGSEGEDVRKIVKGVRAILRRMNSKKCAHHFYRIEAFVDFEKFIRPHKDAGCIF